eukprot:2112780-Amphidinium_carterae.1
MDPTAGTKFCSRKLAVFGHDAHETAGRATFFTKCAVKRTFHANFGAFFAVCRKPGEDNLTECQKSSPVICLKLGKCSMFFKNVLLSGELFNVQWWALLFNQKCASFWGVVQ